MVGEHSLKSNRRGARGRGSPSAVAARVTRLVAHFGRRRVAGAIGVSPETVRRYEAGVTPSARLLRGVVEGLGVSAEWLIMGTGPLLEADRARALVQEAPLSESLGELMRRALEPRAPTGPDSAVARIAVKRNGIRLSGPVESALVSETRVRAR